MKTTVNFCQFTDAFRDMGRDESYSYEGKKALYEYFTELEESCDMEIELDVIAICCEYTEEEPEYFLEQYELDTVEELMGHTTVIKIEGRTSIIIQDY